MDKIIQISATKDIDESPIIYGLSESGKLYLYDASSCDVEDETVVWSLVLNSPKIND